jgi:4-hydroxy-tetrahydrodipicolinate reductase
MTPAFSEVGGSEELHVVGPEGELRPVRAVILGLGGIGRRLLAACSQTSTVELLGLVDAQNEGEKINALTVVGRVQELNIELADVAFVTTSSSFVLTNPLLLELVQRGCNVLSTCEELAFPWLKHRAAARRLDDEARKNDAIVLACGVNPGFVLDALPVFLATAGLDPVTIRATREVSLDTRRPQLGEKLGVGCTIDEWHDRNANDEIGHVGLLESAALCAAGLGWTIREFSFSREPLARQEVVTGVCETARLLCDDSKSIDVELTFRQQGRNVDVVNATGTRPLQMRGDPGIHGDDATIARLLHGARVYSSLRPGLRLPIEVPPAFCGRDELLATVQHV